MHAVTIRRMIVFGVCALGVGSLYLIPSIARTPEQIGVPKANDGPTSGPLGAQSDKSPESASPSGDRDSIDGSHKDRQAAAPTQPSETDSRSIEADEGRSGIQSADQPKGTEDSGPPEPVADIEPSAVTVDQLSLRWPATSDDVGVIGYRIWLNGFEVATTAETQAKLRWFNDDSGHHVVQIRAVDAAGNQSRSSPTLVVTRPSPDPTATPTPSESPKPIESIPPGEPTPDPSRPTPHGHQSRHRQR
jgi:hypothetical protein